MACNTLRQWLIAAGLGALATAYVPAALGTEILTPVEGAPPAPDFTLPDMDGAELRLSDLRGKVVIVNFWATWCPPCRFEMPSLQRAWDVLKAEGGAVIAVHVGGNEDEIWQFMSAHDLDFPIVVDGKSAVIKAWPVLGLPTTFVIDPKGRIRYRAVGERIWDDPAIMEAVKALR